MSKLFPPNLEKKRFGGLLNFKIKQNPKMKTTQSILIVISFFFIAISCKKEEATPTETCKVSIIDRGNGNRHTYTYDANGRVATMTREFDGSGSGNIAKYVYTFTYDNTGLLTKSTWTLDGKADGSETYIYTNSKISKVNYSYVNGSKDVNNIKYDLTGNIIEFTYETGDPNIDAIQYFAYDNNGIMIKHGYKGFDGAIFIETITTPVGVVKSPEQLLVKNALPYDVLTGFSWSIAQGDVGTVTESFFPNSQGKLISDGKEKITTLKLDAKGYISETTSVDINNNSILQRFTLTECN